MWFLLGYFSRIPVIRRFLLRQMEQDIKRLLTEDQNFLILFPAQYGLKGDEALERDIRGFDPSWEAGFIAINMGRESHTIFFIAKSFQLLWDGVAFYRSNLNSKWASLQVETFQSMLLCEDLRRGMSLDTSPLPSRGTALTL